MFSCCSHSDGTSYFASRGSIRHGARNRILIPCFLKTRRHEQPPSSKSSCVRPTSTIISNQPIWKIRNLSIPMRFFARQQFCGLFRQIKFVLSLFLIIQILTRSQPLAALEHPAFINFANIAASAPNGIIDLPSRKQTRGEIIRMFKDHMTALKERLNVSAGFFAHLIGRFRLTIFPLQSKLVSGEISLTCDAWQASNSDAYFAVMGHWIEETSPGKWIKQSALFRFTQMNCAHDGRTLGQALYTICQRLNIVSKVT